MPLNTHKQLKLYYSIKEVAAMFHLNESTLRYWEQELPQLKPKTQPGSKIRQYTQKDIDLLSNIYNLVKVRGFKIAAARKMLAQHPDSVGRQTELITMLTEARDELQEIKSNLDRLT